MTGNEEEKYTEKITFRVKKSTKAELEKRYENPSKAVRGVVESLVKNKQEVSCNV